MCIRDRVGGKPYTDKKEAGTAIIAMCKEIKGINASADVGCLLYTSEADRFVFY